MSEFVTPKEISKILGCSQRHVYDLIKRGKLVAFQDGITRIYRPSLEEYIQKYTVTKKK